LAWSEPMSIDSNKGAWSEKGEASGCREQ
jgi:hypothetical protein